MADDDDECRYSISKVLSRRKAADMSLRFIHVSIANDATIEVSNRT
jgi:hypothetical protein